MASNDQSSALRLLPAAMSFTSGNVAENWERFKRKMDFYFRALSVTKMADKRKIGILMTALGDAGLDIFDSFTDLDKDECTYAEVLEQFDIFCKPRKNTVYERFIFSQIVQGTRSVDVFIVELKNQARKCEFAIEENDNLVRDRIVVGIASPKVRKQMLRDADLTLDTAIDLAKVYERSDVEAAAMLKGLPLPMEQLGVNAFNRSQPSSSIEASAFNRNQPYSSANRSRADLKRCNSCGYEHRNPNAKCPAAEKECNYCHKLGHFSSVCQTRNYKPKVSVVEPTPVSGESSQQNVGTEASSARAVEILQLTAVTTSENKNAWYTLIRVQRTPIRFKVDSGAECNTMKLSVFRTLRPRPPLLPSKAMLRPYGNGELIVPEGEATIRVCVNDKWYSVRFFVVNFPHDQHLTIDNILGLPTIEDVGLVKRTFTISPSMTSKPPIFSEFDDVFDGHTGEIEGCVSLAVKSHYHPVIEKPRRFAFALKPKLCSALTDLEAANIIARVNEPTEWVSNLIVVTKPNGSLRICLDPKYLNEAMIVPKCTIPKSDDIFVELHDKRYFTVFDMKDGFWQMKLDEPSSYLTTFNSPLGRFRWLRLVMGISSAPEIFMNRINELFGDIPGVYPYFDDLIVAGTSAEDHDVNLRAVLARARQVGVKFNAAKVQYRQTTVNYLGFQIGENGVQPLPKHLRAIAEMPSPTDRNGVLRLLGMTRYLARFIPDLSTNTESLRNLTRKDVLFNWEPKHEVEFVNLKKQIQQATNLRFYRPDEPLYVQTDSSKSGVGSCLFQTTAPIAYASRALTRTEQNYAQIEKEMLAVVVAMEKFHDYTYGRPVTVYTDHRPLVSIVKKPISDLTPRLQRLRLRLLRYNPTLVFQPGKELFVADTLSRAYLHDEPADETYQMVDVHCCSNVVATEEKLRDLVTATEADDDLRKLKNFIRGGWPKGKKRLSANLLKFRTFADHLSVRDNLIFFRNRLVIPSNLILSVLNQLHDGHLNVNKTKQFARNTVFWLGMTADIELFIGACDQCNKFRRNNTSESLLSFPAPNRPWQRLHTDILTFNSSDFLVIYDAYSHWIELFSLKSKSVSDVIVHFKNVFARFGVPSQVVSDNIPYNSSEWLAFAEAWHFSVLFSSPRYPQSNGASEKAVAIAKSILQKNVNVQYALLQYRAAPMPHMGYSPAQLLMSRNLKTRLPVTESHLEPMVVDKQLVREKKLRQQETQKFYYNRGAVDLPPLQVGDEIYFKKDLADTEWLPGTVTQIGQSPRSYVVADSNSSGRYLRNRRFIRKPVRFRDVS